MCSISLIKSFSLAFKVALHFFNAWLYAEMYLNSLKHWKLKMKKERLIYLRLRFVFLSWNQIGVKSKNSKAGRQYFSCCLWFWQTIGQAYEDMQTQNQRLLQQVTERDEYNIKVWKGDFWDFVFEICGIFYYRVQCMPAESKEAGIV